MARKLTLISHYPVDELKQRYRNAKDPVESRRWHLIWLVSSDNSLTTAAAVVGMNYDYALEVVKSYNAQGGQGLRNRRKDKRGGPRGSRGLLKGEQLDQLRKRLQSPPPDGGLWSGPKVARVLSEMLGRKVWPQRGWDYLRRLGYSPQRPRPKHLKGDEQEQATFKKTAHPQSNAGTALPLGRR